jgi:hypothetical protein
MTGSQKVLSGLFVRLIGSQKVQAGLFAPREGENVISPSLTDK